MQQDTEEIKGNLLLMMDMLWQLHPKFSVLQPPYTLHSPPNGSLMDRTPQPTVITPFHHTSSTCPTIPTKLCSELNQINALS